MADFLLELGVEEIPARMLAAASAELAERIGRLLHEQRLTQAAEAGSACTPRRLAVIARGIASRQPNVTERLTGPPVKAAFKDGSPTAAAHAFAKKAGVPVERLERVTTPKGEYLAAEVTAPGRVALELLAELLPREIAGLAWPKTMYWRAGKPERFVRPLRWMVALLGDEVVPVEFAGVRAGRESRGHRIVAAASVSISSPAGYAEALKAARVMVDPGERREHIESGLASAAASAGAFRLRRDDDLLATVVNLTEFPSVILGSFDDEFLALPEEVLVTVMRDHQKYFAIEDASGELAPYFLAVLNTAGDRDGLIRHGNERVLRARFNDARFFWQADQKVPLRERVEPLKNVTFQKDLGNYHAKTLRVQRLGSLICEVLRGEEIKVRAGVVHKAALLAKADLTTELVKEFTELQGIVGGLYARVQVLSRPGEPALPEETRLAIAAAIYDQYKPESADDSVPRSVEGAVLSIADKADSVAGMFALGLVPTGSKDPFALRRQANGIIRILAEHKLPLPVSTLFTAARGAYLAEQSRVASLFEEKELAIAEALAAFFRERLEFYLRDVLALAYDVVKAVLAAGADDVLDAVARAQALAAVRHTPDFTSIAASFKRMKNILRQAAEKGIAVPASLAAVPADAASARDAQAEAALFAAIGQVTPRFHAHRKAGDYRATLAELAPLRAPIDDFFDHVMVMAEDPALRGRRLALLQAIIAEFTLVADFSEIVTEKS